MKRKVQLWQHARGLKITVTTSTLSGKHFCNSSPDYPSHQTCTATGQFQLQGQRHTIEVPTRSILCSTQPDLHSHWPVLSFSSQGQTYHSSSPDGPSCVPDDQTYTATGQCYVSVHRGEDIPLKQPRWSILCSRRPDLYSAKYFSPDLEVCIIFSNKA